MVSVRAGFLVVCMVGRGVRVACGVCASGFDLDVGVQ